MSLKSRGLLLWLKLWIPHTICLLSHVDLENISLTSSHKRKDYLMIACDILLCSIEEERVCGYVENIGRDGTKAETCTLGELKDREVNMFTTVFIGNSESEIINGKLITKRGYQRK